MPHALLTRLLLVAAACAIGAEYVNAPWLHFVAKPAATLACVLLAAGARPARSSRYQRGVVIALLFGLAGDVLLMLPNEALFPAGLGVFLIGHFAYLWAFTDGVKFFERPAPAVYFGLVAGLLLIVLLRSVEGPLRAPLVAYVLVLATMAAQARVRALVRPDAGARLAAVGATLFVLSDALLGIERFVTPFPLAHVAILVTYWGAQWALASSVRAPSGEADRA